MPFFGSGYSLVLDHAMNLVLFLTLLRSRLLACQLCAFLRSDFCDILVTLKSFTHCSVGILVWMQMYSIHTTHTLFVTLQQSVQKIKLFVLFEWRAVGSNSRNQFGWCIEISSSKHSVE